MRLSETSRSIILLLFEIGVGMVMLYSPYLSFAGSRIAGILGPIALLGVLAYAVRSKSNWMTSLAPFVIVPLVESAIAVGFYSNGLSEGRLISDPVVQAESYMLANHLTYISSHSPFVGLPLILYALTQIDRIASFESMQLSVTLLVAVFSGLFVYGAARSLGQLAQRPEIPYLAFFSASVCEATFLGPTNYNGYGFYLMLFLLSLLVSNKLGGSIVLPLLLFTGIVLTSAYALVVATLVFMIAVVLTRNTRYLLFMIVSSAFFAYGAVRYIYELRAYVPSVSHGLLSFIQNLLSGEFEAGVAPGTFPYLTTALDNRVIAVSLAGGVLLSLILALFTLRNRARGKLEVSIALGVLFLATAGAAVYVGGSAGSSSAFSDIREHLLRWSILISPLCVLCLDRLFGRRLPRVDLRRLLVLALIITASSAALFHEYPISYHDPINAVEDNRARLPQQGASTGFLMSYLQSGTIYADYGSAYPILSREVELNAKMDLRVNNFAVPSAETGGQLSVVVFNRLGLEYGSVYLPHAYESLHRASLRSDVIYNSGEILTYVP